MNIWKLSESGSQNLQRNNRKSPVSLGSHHQTEKEEEMFENAFN